MVQRVVGAVGVSPLVHEPHHRAAGAGAGRDRRRVVGELIDAVQRRTGRVDQVASGIERDPAHVAQVALGGARGDDIARGRVEHEDPARVVFGHVDVARRVLGQATRDRRAHARARPVQLALEHALVVEDVDVPAGRVGHVQEMVGGDRVDHDVGGHVHLAVAAAECVAVAGMGGVGAGDGGLLPADRLQPGAGVRELGEVGAALVGRPERGAAADQIGRVGGDVIGRAGDAAVGLGAGHVGVGGQVRAGGREPLDAVVPVVADQDRVVGGVPLHTVGVEAGRTAEAVGLLEADGGRGTGRRGQGQPHHGHGKRGQRRAPAAAERAGHGPSFRLRITTRSL